MTDATPLVTGTAGTVRLTRFGSLEVAFDDRVLEPREWTVAQSAWAAELLASAPAGPVLELCAGVGHIGLLAVTGTDRPLVLVDLNPAASELSAVNVAAAGVDDRVDIRTGSMTEVLVPGETFALVIADPPWVESDGIGRFPEDPKIAIDGGEDGLDLARMCCEVIDAHLAPGGSAILQLGTGAQVEAIDAFLADASSSGLRVTAVREFDRGVLALIS
ncbi:MAG: methyltransferase [Aeromicrobium sp.]|nr:methyltransferase [Aeromicrobium sp.]